jgi:NDP-sugar pyrophosphorylase family protein
MKAIIVAGGRGERLRPITDTKPKPIVEVAGKPILLHTVELLKQAGIHEFIFALCYLPNVVKEYFGDGSKFGITITYTLEDPNKPLGTAGAIKESRPFITDSFIVTYADILRELDVRDMIKQHNEKKAFTTIHAYFRKGVDPKSMIIFEKDNKIKQFIKRPSPKDITDEGVWCNGSFYIFEPEIFDYIPKESHSDFGRDIFPAILSKKKSLYAYPTTGFFIDIGTKEKLQKAEESFIKG